MAGLAIGGIVAGKCLFQYNRKNFMLDRKLKQEREFQEQDMRVEQFALYREDVRDLVELTRSKMDLYLVAAALLIDKLTVMVCKQHEALPPLSPEWMVALNALSLCSGVFYLLLSLWLAMYASISAQSFGVRLLTQFVRLPYANTEQIMAASASSQDYESRGVKEMLRVPILQSKGPGTRDESQQASEAPRHSEQAGFVPLPRAPQQSEATAPPGAAPGLSFANPSMSFHNSVTREGRHPGSQAEQTSGAGASAAASEGQAAELEPIDPEKLLPTAMLDHIRLYRKVQLNWQAYDAYARVSLYVGANCLLNCCLYWTLGQFVQNAHATLPAIGSCGIIIAVQVTLARLDMRLQRREVIAIAAILAATLGVTTTGMFLHQNATQALEAHMWENVAIDICATAAFSLQALLMWYLLQSAWPDPTSGAGARLPAKFRSVLYLDVFGWLLNPSGPGTNAQDPYSDGEEDDTGNHDFMMAEEEDGEFESNGHHGASAAGAQASSAQSAQARLAAAARLQRAWQQPETEGPPMAASSSAGASSPTRGQVKRRKSEPQAANQRLQRPANLRPVAGRRSPSGSFHSDEGGAAHGGSFSPPASPLRPRRGRGASADVMDHTASAASGSRVREPSPTEFRRMHSAPGCAEQGIDLAPDVKEEAMRLLNPQGATSRRRVQTTEDIRRPLLLRAETHDGTSPFRRSPESPEPGSAAQPLRKNSLPAVKVSGAAADNGPSHSNATQEVRYGGREAMSAQVVERIVAPSGQNAATFMVAPRQHAAAAAAAVSEAASRRTTRSSVPGETPWKAFMHGTVLIFTMWIGSIIWSIQKVTIGGGWNVKKPKPDHLDSDHWEALGSLLAAPLGLGGGERLRPRSLLCQLRNLTTAGSTLLDGQASAWHAVDSLLRQRSEDAVAALVRASSSSSSSAVGCGSRWPVAAASVSCPDDRAATSSSAASLAGCLLLQLRKDGRAAEVCSVTAAGPHGEAPVLRPLALLLWTAEGVPPLAFLSLQQPLSESMAAVGSTSQADRGWLNGQSLPLRAYARSRSGELLALRLQLPERLLGEGRRPMRYSGRTPTTLRLLPDFELWPKAAPPAPSAGLGERLLSFGPLLVSVQHRGLPEEEEDEGFCIEGASGAASCDERSSAVQKKTAGVFLWNAEDGRHEALRLEPWRTSPEFFSAVQNYCQRSFAAAL
eukprot:TRINITY_DN7685_c0_g1_i1.p1 TRINITY_DN7685_c0_g1~~TRINITY_DN7685_c0_g1_i1.p1  ORF type:complete len:1183 (+),score=301.45 TRINITY_DN7685_c0_g1_i1:79-3627(+)